MDTCCCRTGTVADWDRESHRRKKLAVLCHSVALKSTGAHLNWCLIEVQQPIILTNRSGCCSSPRDCRCCGHYQLCWTQPLPVNVLLIKLLLLAVLHGLLPNKTAKHTVLFWIQDYIFNLRKCCCCHCAHSDTVYTLLLPWFCYTCVLTPHHSIRNAAHEFKSPTQVLPLLWARGSVAGHM